MRIGLGFDTEQEALRQGVRSYLLKHGDEARVRDVMASESGVDDVLWRGLAVELGCHGLHLPPELGGAGAGLVEQGVVAEELGRSLACVPYLSTVGLALGLLRRFPDDPAYAELAPRIAAGEARGTVALCEPGGGWDPAAVVMTAHRVTLDHHTLTGTKTYVPDGHTADVVLVVARVDGDLGVLVVDGDAPGLRRTALPTMDQTRRQARLDFTDVAARPLRPSSEVPAVAVERALAQACALLAVEQAGAAQHVLDATVEYAKARTQFGAPIGSFQAVRHRLADVLGDVEAARSAAYYAVAAAEADDDELLGAASLAKAFCSDALVRTTYASVQVHGGIGLTWEHWAHLYLKRARSSAVLLGDATWHRERLAGTLGL